MGFHHYAFELRSRSDVDALQVYLEQNDIEIADAAAEHYPNYYAVYFFDPDGMKLEGMKYGPPQRRKTTSTKKAARKTASSKRGRSS